MESRVENESCSPVVTELEASPSVPPLVKQEKRRKPGIVYLSSIPPYMRPLKIRHVFSQYGDIGRVYLQPEGTWSRAVGNNVSYFLLRSTSAQTQKETGWKQEKKIHRRMGGVQ